MRNEAFKKKLDNILDFKGLRACKTFLEKYKEVKKLTHNSTTQIKPPLTFCCLPGVFFYAFIYVIYF